MNSSKGLTGLSYTEVERLIRGDATVDPSLAGFLSQVRELAEAPPRKLAASHISMLAEAARSAASAAPALQPALMERRPGLLRRRLGTRAAAVAFALLLLGAGVAAAATGTLPDPAQTAIANVAAQIGLDIPGADQEPGDEVSAASSVYSGEVAENAQEYVQAVRQAVNRYTEELEGWVDCVKESSAPACGDKPKLDMPHPSNFGLGPPEDAGPPEHSGAPDHAGPSGQGGPPDDPAPPGQAGQPEETGPPDDKGPPEQAGKPDEPGPPDSPGRSADAGKSDNTPKGPPSDED